MRKLASRSVATMLFVTLAACSSPTAPAPGIQPQISSVADNFQYQVMSVQNYTGTASYSWQNSGAQATVNQATTLTAGTATVVLLDANGTQVYSSSLSNNGTFTSSVGTAGAWTVRVSYSAATSPSVNFRAQKF